MAEEQPVETAAPDVQALLRQHPADVADILAKLKDEEALDLLHRLSTRRAAAGPLEEMEPEAAARLIEGMDRDEAVAILSRMAPDDAVDLLGELPPATIRDILGRLGREESRELSELLQYPEDTAGGMMSPDVVALPLNLTAQQAIEALRQKAAVAETLYYAYVVDEEKKLLGVLPLRDLALAAPDRPIERIMIRDVRSLPAAAPREEVRRTFDKFNFLALPVLDGQRRLLGIITVDDVMDAAREEDTEDILRLGGIPGGEDHPFARPADSVRKRLPWMAANMLFNLVAVAGVALFEDTVARLAFLAVLMPIISDMGGNVASQAMAVAIRGLALGKIDWKDLGRVLRKEFVVGFVNGLVLGLQIGVIAFLWKGNVYLGLVAAVSMWINTILATAIGGGFPFLARRVGLDPAMMSGAVVTTITDLTGFLLFLGLATAWLAWLT